MPQKINKMALLAKIETVYGTDAVATGALNAMLVHDVSLTPLEGDEAARNNVRPFFGQPGTIRATSYRKLSFGVEYSGSGTAGTQPAWGPLMRACSMSATVVAVTSVTYAPITDGQESLTLVCNIDGVNCLLTGARGTVKLNLTAKDKPKLMFEFTGLFSPVTDSALPASVYTAFVRPLAVNRANTTASLHGQAVATQSFELDLGNSVVKRDLIGVDTVEITDRKAAGQIVFESTTVAVRNWVGIAQAKTLGNLTIAHGTVAGNICTVNATGTVELGNLSYSDSDGIQMSNVPLRFLPLAGNDEFSLVLT